MTISIKVDKWSVKHLEALMVKYGYTRKLLCHEMKTSNVNIGRAWGESPNIRRRAIEFIEARAVSLGKSSI